MEWYAQVEMLMKFSSLAAQKVVFTTSLIARFMGPTWGSSGADTTQVGSMLAPWTLLSGFFLTTLGAASDDDFMKIMIFPFQCMW